MIDNHDLLAMLPHVDSSFVKHLRHASTDSKQLSRISAGVVCAQVEREMVGLYPEYDSSRGDYNLTIRLSPFCDTVEEFVGYQLDLTFKGKTVFKTNTEFDLKTVGLDYVG